MATYDINKYWSITVSGKQKVRVGWQATATVVRRDTGDRVGPDFSGEGRVHTSAERHAKESAEEWVRTQRTPPDGWAEPK
ncbi:hypothetical protein EPO34_02705 [Patescibacteria group bacterium]|nr:MAG: hypothetical protein EPO34_02705 [Patescibacteria group bacterium]